MCGIAGIWAYGASAGEPAESIRPMLDRIRHRGPDGSGTWVEARTGLVLGHRRLAVIDLSAAANQPMLLADRDLVIVFNGEIYNFRELREELGGDAAFVTHSDTEVLLRGYERWGTAVLDRLVGMFAFALWDGQREELFLARDRAGEKPLYYTSAPTAFACASEIGALELLPWVDTAVDAQAVTAYLNLQYVPAPLSIFRGVRKLSPAHAMIVRRDGIRQWRYWDPLPSALASRLALDETEAEDRLGDLLRQSVRGQMIADVPLGAFLSGGIDSSAVVAAMVDAQSAPVRTFTIGFEVPEYNEAPHAEAVARCLGTQHTTEYLTERDALELIPRIPEMYGEPFADSSALPTHLVSRVARRHVTVSLSGDGGDELFGGYTRYDRLRQVRRLLSVAGPLGFAIGPALRLAGGRYARWAKHLDRPPQDLYRRMLGIFDDDETRALTGTAFGFPEFDRAWSADVPTMQRKAMLSDLLTYMPEAILVKVDRAAMAVSLETRAPLLDHRLIEFSLRLPGSMVRGKRLLKRWTSRRVPREILERPKKGFGVPLGKWFREDLRDLVGDLLTPTRLTDLGIRDTAVVARILDQHASGAIDHHPRIWALLVLSLWHDRPRPAKSAGLSPVRVDALS